MEQGSSDHFSAILSLKYKKNGGVIINKGLRFEHLKKSEMNATLILLCKSTPCVGRYIKIIGEICEHLSKLMESNYNWVSSGKFKIVSIFW